MYIHPADGLVPRSDGLIWECDDFDTDGTHPSAQGANKAAGLLLDFFTSDATAAPWFTRGSSDAAGPDRPAARPASAGLAVLPAFPDPSSGVVGIPLRVERALRFRAVLPGPQGREIRTIGGVRLAAGWHELLWDGRDDNGRPAPAGQYLLRVVDSRGAVASAKICRVR